MKAVIPRLVCVFLIVAGWFLLVSSSEIKIISSRRVSLSQQMILPVSLPAGSSHTAKRVSSQFVNQDREVLLQLTAGIHPGRGVSIPAAQDVHDLPVEDISFYNMRGNLISGWFALYSPQAPVIILTHGTPGNRVSMISRATFLYKLGYNVLLFDFQSYGRSQGIMSTLGMVESEDILEAISYLHAQANTAYSKIGVLGLSMGATAAVLAAAHTSDIEAVVAESCPVDASRVPGDVSSETAREADRQLVEETYGVDITQARPIDVVNRLAGRTAIFFINGDADTITPLAGMQALYQAASAPKQDWVVPGAEHAQSFDLATSEYIDRVGSFFSTYLSHV